MSEQHMVFFFLDIFVFLHFFYGDMAFRTNTDGLLRRISTFSKQLVFKFKTQKNDWWQPRLKHLCGMCSWRWNGALANHSCYSLHDMIIVLGKCILCITPGFNKQIKCRLTLTYCCCNDLILDLGYHHQVIINLGLQCMDNNYCVFIARLTHHLCTYRLYRALPCECDLEDPVSCDEWGQSGQALFTWAPNTHQQGVASRCPDYSRHLCKQINKHE